VGSFFFFCHNYNKGKFGFFFLVTINIIGGEIYLYFFTMIVFSNFDIFEFACYISNLCKTLQADYNKFI